MYDHIINKMALMTPSSSKKSILGEDTLSRTSKLLGLNNNIWNVYKTGLTWLVPTVLLLSTF